MVKITKYTKEKRKQDSEKHRKERSKHKYKTTQNMRYILSEIWKSQPLMLVVRLCAWLLLSQNCFSLALRANMLLSLLWERRQEFTLR